MNILFLFLDGIGLGADDNHKNPFTTVQMPNMESVLDGHRLTLNKVRRPINTKRATLLALDACLGVEGRPQSASGQASLLTGKNVPQIIGQHYGPKPNAAIKTLLETENIFSKLKQYGYRTAFLNAFPDGYFKMIDSGRRLPGAISMAAQIAGVPLKNIDDLFNGDALSADFTAEGWSKHLGIPNVPFITPDQAGIRLAHLAKRYHFSLFEYWLSDYAGHKQDLSGAKMLLKTFDQVLGGLLAEWDDDQGLILITSDHGNFEDMTIRNHTRNPVPAILIGNPSLRKDFTQKLEDLTDIYPAIFQFLNYSN